MPFKHENENKRVIWNERLLLWTFVIIFYFCLDDSLGFTSAFLTWLGFTNFKSASLRKYIGYIVLLGILIMNIINICMIFSGCWKSHKLGHKANLIGKEDVKLL